MSSVEGSERGRVERVVGWVRHADSLPRLRDAQRAISTSSRHAAHMECDALEDTVEPVAIEAKLHSASWVA